GGACGFRSGSIWKLPYAGWEAGMVVLVTHEPLAYWKKSWHGEQVVSRPLRSRPWPATAVSRGAESASKRARVSVDEREVCMRASSGFRDGEPGRAEAGENLALRRTLLASRRRVPRRSSPRWTAPERRPARDRHRASWWRMVRTSRAACSS